MDYKLISAQVGNALATGTQKAVVWLASLGVNINSTGAKIINIIIFLVLGYIVIKILQNLKPLIKWSIIVLLVLLVLSTIISFVP